MAGGSAQVRDWVVRRADCFSISGKGGKLRCLGVLVYGYGSMLYRFNAIFCDCPYGFDIRAVQRSLLRPRRDAEIYM